MRARLLAGSLGEHNCGERGGIGAAEQSRQQNAATSFRPELQEVAAVGNGADHNNDQPHFERIEAKGAKRLIRHDGQDYGGEQQKLREGKDLVARHPLGETLEPRLQLKQRDGEHREGDGDPIFLARNKRSDHVGHQAGKLGRHSGQRHTLELVPVG